jgi:hypothetical protein
MFHFNELMNLKLSIFVSYKHEDRVFFCLHPENLGVRSIKKRQLIVKIINLKFIQSFFRFDLNDVVSKKLNHFFRTIEWVVILFFIFCFRITFEPMLVVM